LGEGAALEGGVICGYYSQSNVRSKISLSDTVDLFADSLQLQAIFFLGEGAEQQINLVLI
jgi:hypothetical protein